MATKDGSQAIEFVRAQLKKNPTISYAEVAELASRRGMKLYPIMYGRAKALEGLVPVAPRGTGKHARKKAGSTGGGTVAAANSMPMRRGPGRPPRSASAGSAMQGLDALVNAMKEGERERDRYRRALEQISRILQDAL